MTRVNCVPPKVLKDRHLLAEYHELPRIITLVEKLIAKKGSVVIPDSYRLGSGHMLFFYDKCTYLLNRLVDIKIELEERGYTIDQDKFNAIQSRVWKLDKQWRNDWIPSPYDMYINMGRLVDRDYK